MAVNEVKKFFDGFFTNKNDKATDVIGGENEQFEYFERLLKEFYNTDNMRLKTDLKRNQILLLSVATIYRDVFHSSVMDKFITYLTEYSVSVDRKGRAEFENIFKFITSSTVDGLDPNNALATMLGLGRRI